MIEAATELRGAAYQIGVSVLAGLFEDVVRFYVMQTTGEWNEIVLRRVAMLPDSSGEYPRVQWKVILGMMIAYSEYHVILSDGSRHPAKHVHWGRQPADPQLRRWGGLRKKA